MPSPSELVRDPLAFALLVLDRFAAGEGPFTPADAARVATTIRRGPVANSIEASFVEPDLDTDLAGYRIDNERRARTSRINAQIAEMEWVPDDLQVAQLVLQLAPGWTFTIDRAGAKPLVVLTSYEPDRPL